MRVLRLDTPMDGHTFDTKVGAAAGVALQVHPVQGDEAQTWAAFAQAHVYHIASARDDLPPHWLAGQALIERSPQLLAVSTYGAGYDTVDVAACTAAGIAVVNQAGGNADSVAEHTLALMLGISRRMVESDRRMRREIGFSREDVMGHEIRGKTLGLIGMGHIGTRVARLAQAFGMTVIASDPLLSAEEIAQRGARSVSLAELLAQSDVVSLHCPRDATTLKMMNDTTFAQMKKGALFINTARGGIHDEVALTQALASGHLAGAGLDVWDQEPPPLDHPLLAMDNVYATFHTAGVTHEARRNVASIGADQIIQLLAGERPPRLVNPQVWPAFEKRRVALGL